MRPDEKVDLLDPRGQREAGHAALPQRQPEMDQHHAKVDGEAVSQVGPSIRLLSMQPDTRRLLLLFHAIHQIDLGLLVLREALRDLEHLAVPRIPTEKAEALALEVG